MNIAAAVSVKERLIPAVRALRDAISKKADEWKDIVKIGRTHMQDATPLTLGQEWSGYAGTLTDNLERIENTLQGVYRRILEETAVRVGIVAPHRQLLHHLVLAELLFLTSAVSGLLDRQSTIPNKSLAASILAHQAFLSTCRLQPVARESLLYSH